MSVRIKLTAALRGGALWSVSSVSLLAISGCTLITAISPEGDGGVGDATLVSPSQPNFNVQESADGGLEIDLPRTEGSLSLEVGVPDSTSEILFGTLRRGGDIPFAGVGQSGLTARIGLRVPAPNAEANLDRLVQVDIIRADAPTIRPAQNRLRDSPSSLRCMDGYCILVPLHLQILHLNDLDALDGTVVVVKARVEDPDDPEKFGETYSWGVLRYVP